MIQLRGLNLWPFSSDEPQAPSADTVRSWWGSVTSPSTQPYKEYKNAILATNLINMPSAPPTPTPPNPGPTPPNPLFQPVTPGTTVVTSGGKPRWASWWMLGLAAAGGVGLWMYSRPKSSPASTAIAGLFKRRR